jgi:sugar (pentulose or hexulose) kinase
MPLTIGLDLGTTTITAVAVNTGTGEVAACATAANRAEVTPQADRARGRSEWDPAGIALAARKCLSHLVEQLGPSRQEIAGLGITGQQHGVLLVDRELRPLSNLINWQDRRGEEPYPGAGHTWVQEARRRLGEAAPRRTGCRLATGYMALTLFWLAENGKLPEGSRACFLMDYMTALLTGTSPVTDPTCAASAGVLDVAKGDWAFDLIDALGLPRDVFPPVRPSGTYAGLLTHAIVEKLGKPQGVPVYGGIGDNQASFLGSVADRADSVLVNVGTGGQVAVWSPAFAYDPHLETRPFPGDGYLLVSAGLSGGAAYAQLERFFRAVAAEVAGADNPADVYAIMNRLAEAVPPGCDGLVCEPFFTGTRAEPWRRASWSNLSPGNFTAAHLARSLLEGMARTFAGSRNRIAGLRGSSPGTLVGAGNGIRSNPLLARIISDHFAMPMRVPAHREEAAFGAALLTAVRAGLVPDLAAAGRLIRLLQ